MWHFRTNKERLSIMPRMNDRIGRFEVTEPPTSAGLRQRIVETLGGKAVGGTISMSARNQETQEESPFTFRVVSLRQRDDTSLAVIGENIGGTILSIEVAADGEQPASLRTIQQDQSQETAL